MVYKITPSSKIRILQHHLHLFGLNKELWGSTKSSLIFIDQINEHVDSTLADGGIALAIHPNRDLLNKLQISSRIASVKHSFDLEGSSPLSKKPVNKLRTFYDFYTFKGASLEPVVSTAEGEIVWAWMPRLNGGILLLGSNLAEDLTRFRQGDPSKANSRPNTALWGIAGERPNYLFTDQLEGLSRYARPADEWSEQLASFIASKLLCLRLPLLPGGAHGAIVITGDDDQAHLEKYEEQLKLLAGMPITYFLHPLTRHTRSSLERIQSKNHRVNFGIHPDALENPAEYSRLLKEQCNWFNDLADTRAEILRNHGYLNDGYWGHLEPWINEGINFSSNIPGFDGCALNGSLLPSRVVHNGGLTDHWSIVTAIGDGIRYVNGGRSDLECANCIFDLADSVRQSDIPGVMVLNLHPQNIGDTRAMHLAIHEVVKSGFIIWNMSECLSWFSGKSIATPTQSILQRIRRFL
jgi:hypothetical protein